MLKLSDAFETGAECMESDIEGKVQMSNRKLSKESSSEIHEAAVDKDARAAL